MRQLDVRGISVKQLKREPAKYSSERDVELRMRQATWNISNNTASSVEKLT